MFKGLKRKLLTIFGDIKIFKWPFWIVYDPDMYLMTGAKIREVLDVIKIGDVVGRRYRHYADGLFIPGKYSHTGIYVGDGKIIHAVAEGVCECDILDFLACDGCVIMRSKNQGAADYAVSKAKSYLGKPYDFDFSDGDTELYCHEMTANCYKDLDIEMFIPEILWGLIKGKHKVYLAKSFIENPNFEKVYET